MNKSENQNAFTTFSQPQNESVGPFKAFLSTEKRDFSTFSYTSTSEIDFVDRVSVLKPTLTLICHLGQNVGLGEE